MDYRSTRSSGQVATASAALVSGLAPDGGLFVPDHFPHFDYKDFMDKSYGEVAATILAEFFPDFPVNKIQEMTKVYQRKFVGVYPAPLTTLGSYSFLELFHGPTASFKDMALSLLPSLMEAGYRNLEKKERILVLVATSGDTGSAALEGFATQPGIDIAVFYPEHGVSEMQKRQMEAVKSPSTHVFAIDGNFDDAQRAVKFLLNDEEMRPYAQERGWVFSSANSINIGRLIPQMVYYFTSYVKLIQDGLLKDGELLDVSVPTGNFGDILAGVYAKACGLPIGNFYCASNENKVLADFFETGTYDARRTFIKTSSPSMDILVSSNLERYLYHLSGGDSDLIRKLFDDLKVGGSFTWPTNLADDMFGSSTSQEETIRGIKEVYEEHGYLIDPHTAVAYQAAKASKNHCLVVSTASPYKFPETSLKAILPEAGNLSVEEMAAKIEDLSSAPIPSRLQEVLAEDGASKRKITSDEIIDVVKEILTNES